MPELIDDFLASPIVSAAVMAMAGATIALWVAAAWWAYADAIRRTETTLAGYVAAAWIILSTPLMLPLSVAAYALARPPVPAGEGRVRTLVEALRATADGPACGTCGEPIDGAWLRCPDCATWLATPCASCGGWSEAGLELCPWCGEEARGEPYVPDLVPAAAPMPRLVPVMASADDLDAIDADADMHLDEPVRVRGPRFAWRSRGLSVARARRGGPADHADRPTRPLGAREARRGGRARSHA